MLPEIVNKENTTQKRFKKILFIIPKVQASYAAKLDPHLGIAYLTAILEKNNFQVEIFDFALDYQFEDLTEKVKTFQPDLIGITLFSFDFVNSYKLINKIKDQFNFPVVLGGVHVSSVKEDVLKKTNADYALYREAENSIVELCQGKPLEEIKGLIYKKDNQIIKNPPAEFIKNLDGFPFPAYEKFELKKYTYPQEGRLQIATSRGCPYSCSYCAVKLSMGLGFRPRSPENVIQEIEHWYSKGYTFFEFVDDCFTLDMDRAKKICDLIIQKNLKIKWNCANGIRADRVDEELLRKMKQAGCVFLSYGLETGNPNILQKIKKAITLEKAIETFKLTKKIGIRFAVNFIIGHIDETYDTAKDTIEFAKSIPCDSFYINNMVPYPGTEMYQYVKENGRFLVPEEIYLSQTKTKGGKPIFETPDFQYKERKKLVKTASYYSLKKHLQYRLGKTTGFLLSQVARSNKLYTLTRTFAGSDKGRKIFNILKTQN